MGSKYAGRRPTTFADKMQLAAALRGKAAIGCAVDPHALRPDTRRVLLGNHLIAHVRRTDEWRLSWNGYYALFPHAAQEREGWQRGISSRLYEQLETWEGLLQGNEIRHACKFDTRTCDFPTWRSYRLSRRSMAVLKRASRGLVLHYVGDGEMFEPLKHSALTDSVWPCVRAGLLTAHLANPPDPDEFGDLRIGVRFALTEAGGDALANNLLNVGAKLRVRSDSLF
jgi:hypothetical protein